MAYETGKREEVVAELIRCAIQDRVALIDAHQSWNHALEKYEYLADDSSVAP